MAVCLCVRLSAVDMKVVLEKTRKDLPDVDAAGAGADLT
jgi:hypothetical protein